MKLIALNCRNCGAPLQVPDDLKHVTCMHCETQLAIVHEGGAAYTEKLDALSERTDQIEDKLAELNRRQKLTALEQSWQREQESLKIRAKDGSAHLPSKTGGIITGVAGVCVGIFIMMLGIGSVGGSEAGGGMVLIGFLFIFIGIGGAIWQVHRADKYEKAKQRYQSRRRQIRNG